MKELLTPGGEHHGIGDGDVLGDDEDRRSPSPEPQTDSRSALPRKNMAWRRLRLVDRDNSSSLIFFPGKIGFYSVGFRVCGATRWGQPTWERREGWVPWWVVPTQVPPSGGSWLQKFSLLIYKFLAKFCSIPRTFISARKQHHGSSA